MTYNVFTFAEVRGDSFTRENHLKTAAFFKKVEDTSNTPKNIIKDIIHRERPYKTFSNQVKPLLTIEGGYSFPSGHSMRSWLHALLMGDLDPEKRANYLFCATRVNTDRIIGGMYHPSDAVAGRALAQAIDEALMADSSFKLELEQFRKAEYTN